MKKVLVVALLALLCGQLFIMSMQPNEQISPENIKKLPADIKGEITKYKTVDALGSEYGAFKNKVLNALKPITLSGHTDLIDSIAISPDGSFIVTGSKDNTAKIWGTDGRLKHTLTGHTGEIDSIAISPDSSYIVTGSLDDKTANIWDAKSGNLLHALSGHTGAINSVAISHDGSFIVTGSKDATAKIWGTDGMLKHTLLNPKVSTGQNKAKISPDSSYIVTTTGDVWDQYGNLKHTLSAWITSVAISPDSSFIVTGSPRDHTAKIWGTDGTLKHVLSGHTGMIASVAISPDNSFIVTGSYDNTAKIWSADGSLKHTLTGGQSLIFSVAISPDSSYIATTDLDGRINIWGTDGSLKHTLGSGYPVAISPDGNYIVTGSSDKTAKVWPQLGILKKLDAIAHLERFPGDKPNWPELRVAFMRKLIEATKENGNFTTKLFGYFGYSKKLMLDPALQKDGKPGTLYMIYKTVFDKDMQNALAPFIQIKQSIPGGFYSDK